MPRNSSGTFNLILPPVVPDTTIESSWANTTLDDIAIGLTQSLDREGRGGMVGSFRLVDGTETGPGLAFTGETGTGLYRPNSNVLGVAVQGSGQVGTFSAAGLTIQTGFHLKLLDDPVADADAVNKKFLTDYVASEVGDYLPLSGGTLTGALTGTTSTFGTSVTAPTFNTVGGVFRAQSATTLQVAAATGGLIAFTTDYGSSYQEAGGDFYFGKNAYAPSGGVYAGVEVATPVIQASATLALNTTTASLVLGSSAFRPAASGTIALGGVSNRWGTAYGTTADFTGTVTAPTFSGNATSATTATTATTATNLSGGTVNATSGSFSGTVTTSSVFIGNLTGNATNATNAQTAAAVTGLIKFISTEITCPAATANVSQAHGKGSAPTIANAVLRCVTASDGWGVGDEIILTDTENCGFQIWSNATSIGWVYTTTSAGAPEIRTPVGVTQRCTAANWKVVLKGVWLP